MYYFAFVVLLAYQLTTKPRILESLRHLRCQKLKYWLIWAPFLLLAIFCEISTILVCKKMSAFSDLWITELHDRK